MWTLPCAPIVKNHHLRQYAHTDTFYIPGRVCPKKQKTWKYPTCLKRNSSGRTTNFGADESLGGSSLNTHLWNLKTKKWRARVSLPHRYPALICRVIIIRETSNGTVFTEEIIPANEQEFPDHHHHFTKTWQTGSDHDNQKWPGMRTHINDSSQSFSK